MECEQCIQCEFCQKVFKSHTTLIKHKCPFCRSCKTVFSTFQRFKSHKCQGLQGAPVTAVEQRRTVFNPVQVEWQLQRCQQLKLPLKTMLPSAHVQLEAGAPKQIVAIGGDGNCFFRCMSLVLTGHEDYHLQLRSAVCRFMTSSEHRDRLERFLLQGQRQSAESYLDSSYMNRSGIWATDTEIFTAAVMLNTKICIYRRVHGQAAWHTFDPKWIVPQAQVDAQCIYINHLSNTHYEVVTDVHPLSLASVPLCQRHSSIPAEPHETLLTAELSQQIPTQSHTSAKDQSFKQLLKKIQMMRLRKGHYRKMEKARDQQKRAETRTVSEHKQKEDVRDRKRKAARRQNEVYKQKEVIRSREQKATKRLNEEYKQKEVIINREKKATKRLNEEYKQKEVITNREQKATKRQNEEYKQKEVVRNRDQMVTRRQNEEYKQKESVRNRTKMAVRRQNVTYKQKETVKNREQMTRRRKIAEYKKQEAVRNKGGMANRRKKTEYRQKEAVRNREQKAKRRGSTDYKKKEAERQKTLKAKKRMSQEYKQKESFWTKVSIQRRKYVRKLRNNSQVTLDNVKQTFQSNLSHGPVFVCTCCDGLFYKHSVSVAPSLKSLHQKGICSKLIQQVLRGVKSFQNTEWICKTCLRNLKKPVLPDLAVSNGLEFPVIPPQLVGLTTLEERCISPRIPFMQLRELGRDHQFGIRGNVVNVPVDVPATVTSLPRHFGDTETIALKLKRRIRYKSSYHFENVRPQKIFAAAQWLIENSDLYKDEGIQLDPSWYRPEWENVDEVEFKIEGQDSIEHDESTLRQQDESAPERQECIETAQESQHVESQCDHENILLTQSTKDQDDEHPGHVDNDCREVEVENVPSCDNKEGAEEDDEDKDWVEISQEAELGIGCRDTLLHPNDFTSDGQQALVIAPGEGKHPLGLFLDKDCEEKSFPTIFCGQRRIDNNDRSKSLTYSKICKAELRSVDRRAAHSIANIFFKLKKLQMLQIRDLATTALRKVKGSKKDYTAGQLKKEGAIEDLLRQDEGYRILKTLRSSPPYWQARQKELFAIIRQLGKPTFFATFSAAETRWFDLLRVLYRMEHNEDITDDELRNLTWQEKAQLIQKDPVTCARHFDYRVQVLFRKVILSDLQPLGKVTDYFYRVEFQQRGSPHIHCLLWVEGAPDADLDSVSEVEQFVDKYLTCQRHEVGELKEVSDLHEHRHSKSCKKGGRHVCRFGFPLYPMPRTMLLDPFTLTDKENHPKIQDHLNKIEIELQKLKPGEDISFEDFLARVGGDEKQYVLAIRSDLDRTKIFLRRKPSETRMNSRNDALAQIWMANTDVQFILDEYACGVYILTYISKSQRGMSDLLRDAADEAKRGNHKVRDQVRHIANKFLNHCEISAQEAVYLLLQLPMCRSTRDVIFVNTSPPSQRVRLLKNSAVLEMMTEDDTDVTCTSLIDRYAERPKQLEHICLAEFATWYDVRKAGSYATTRKSTGEFLPEEDYEEDVTDNIWNNDASSGIVHKLPDGRNLHRRTKAKVLRCVRFSVVSEPENHYREKLMLYMPWRDELTDIIGQCASYHDRYKEMKDKIKDIEQQFESNAAAVDHAMEQVQKVGVDEDVYDEVAPVAQDIESHQEQFNTDSTANAAFQPRCEQHKQYDIGLDLGCQTTVNMTSESLTHRLSDEELSDLIKSLNSKQKQFFYHILHWIKTKCSGSLSASEPFHCFLSGGAGVGKSRSVLAIYHALVRFLSSRPGDNPDCLRVLLTAPTGKAAYNIKGITLHTAFFLPANQSLNEYIKLDASRLNTLRSSLAELRVLIIDEISMVGASMLSFIDQRLQEVMGSNRPFGGVSVLAVGDLFQLRPVMDRWVFQPCHGLYEALAPVVWQDLFRLFELTEVMRQKDDKIFASILNRIREGQHTKDDECVIKSCVKSNVPNNMLHLFISRQLVSEHNARSLAQLQSPEIHLKASDSVMGDVSPALKAELLHRVLDMNVQQTQSLSSLLTVKVGARFMLVHNIDIGDGLTNGASGTLRQVGHTGREDPEHVSVVWIEFDEDTVGKKTREQNKQLYTQAISTKWTPVFQNFKQFRIGKRENVTILRRQFPLTACCAITIHKSQGSTLEKVAVSFQGRAQHHLVYVALSRAKSMDGLHLIDFDSNKIKVSPEVKNEMERLRKEPLVPCVTDLQYVSSTGYVIIFHNSRSLHKHIADLRSEENLLQAHLLFIFESWELEQDDAQHYNLDGFALVARNTAPSKSHRPHAGTLVYTRDHSMPFSSSACRKCAHSIEITVVDASNSVTGLGVVGVYCPPRVSITAMCTELRTVIQHVLKSHTVIIIGGDFNCDVSGGLPNPIQQLCDDFSLKQLITGPTTDYGSTLDLILTNLSETTPAGVLESWYSDHKPCWVTCLL